jgi:outer membrane receptor protein involved in Fe transport
MVAAALFLSRARELMPIHSYAAARACALLTTVAAAHTAVAAGDGTTPDTIVVTATRSARTLSDIPESVSVVDANEIAATPSQALDDVLRRSPSIDLPSATSYQLHPTANSVSMRGLGGIRALVLLDDVPINDPFFGYLQWSRVPLELVDHVEIVRGGGATLWGNYAMGGVINIRTREPVDHEVVLQGGVGSYGTYRANAFASFAPSESAHVAFSAGRNHTDGFMQIEPDERGPVNVPTAFTSNNAAFRGAFDFARNFKLAARVDYFDDDQTLQTRLSRNSQRTWNYSATLDRSFDSDAGLALTVFGSDSQFETQNTGGFDGIPENEAEFVENVHRTPVDDLGVSLVWSKSFASGWLRGYSVGMDLHRLAGQDVAFIYDPSESLVRTDLGQGKQQFAGGFAQASIRPAAALEILASARYQSFRNFDAYDGTPGGLGNAPSSSEDSIDPRLSLRYVLTKSVALRVAYYTAFRAPTLDNLYRAFSVPFGIFYANPALVPESLKGGEVGFDVRTERLRLQVTAYRNDIDDLITSRNLDVAELPPGFFFGSRNINAGNARSRGLELETDWSIAQRVSARFSYTHADSQITANDLDPASVGQQISGVPRNRAAVSVSYVSAKGWRLTPQLRWLAASFGDNDHTLPVDAQHIVDLSASYPFRGGLEAFVAVANLTNERYVADNSGFSPPLRGTPLSVFVGVRSRR